MLSFVPISGKYILSTSLSLLFCTSVGRLYEELKQTEFIIFLFKNHFVNRHLVKNTL
jgi:hypothetical protein